MSKTWRVAVGILGILAVAIVVIVLWPASDPLADVETVAIRVGGDPSERSPVAVEEELHVVLGDRDITVVGDEARADAVLEVTDLTVNLGDVEISLSDAGIRGRASAICTVRDIREGTTHVMDFHIRFDRDGVRADLVPRKFWELWKRRPSG